MKKIIATIVLVLMFPLFTACEISNTDLANSLEGNMTRLVYSVGYLDRISTEELSGLVNNSTYFTHSSLYNNADIQSGNALNSTSTETNNLANDDNAVATLNGGLASTQTSGRLGLQSSAYRSNTYSSNLSPATNALTLSDETTAGAYSVGRVDLSLLETNADDLNQILLDISTKRGIIMLYCTDLRSGRASLSVQDKEAISEYNDLLAEATNYLNSNTGTLTNYFNGITSINTQENSAELINAKLIRANEVLKTRYAKLDTCLDSLNAIINIMVNSIGYDYSNLYTPQNGTTESLVDIATTQNEVNNTTINSTLTEQSALSNPLNQSVQLENNNNCCPACPNCTTATPVPYPIIPNGATCTNDNLTTSNNCRDCQNTNVSNDINYGTLNSFNSLNPGSTTISNNGCNIDSPTTLELTDKDYGLTNNENLATQEQTTALSETEIILNGGLVRGENVEKITPSTANSVIASACLAPAPPANRGLDIDNKFARELNLANPITKKEASPNPETITPLPNKSQIKDFSDTEFYEGEKELSPELLPFAGTTPEPNTLEVKPLSYSELGAVNFLPIKYENDDCIKRIPLQ